MKVAEIYGPAIQEIEKFVVALDPSIRAEAFRFLINRQFVSEREVPEPRSPERPKTSSASRKLSPQELLRKTDVHTMVDIATVLGYWLEMHEGETSFSSGR